MSDNKSEDLVAEEARNNGLWPAYPNQPLDGSGMPCAEHAPGLTKREQFAMAAMQGIFAHGYVMPIESVEAAVYAVRAADALLQELAK